MVARARESGLPAIVTTMFDSGIGTAAAIHLDALCGSDAPASGLATLKQLEHSLLRSDPEVSNGTLTVPAGAGLGVELDFNALERYATGPRYEMAA